MGDTQGYHRDIARNTGASNEEGRLPGGHRIHLEGAYVAAIPARRIGNGSHILRTAVATLIGVNAKAVALVNGRAPGEQRMRRGQAAVLLQRPEERVNGRIGGSRQVAL